MAKAKKTKKGKTKVRDLKARKPVKGGLGVRRTGDPCDGGEIASRIS